MTLPAMTFSEAAKVAARRGDGFWTLADPERVPELLEVYPSGRDAAAAAQLWRLTEDALGCPLPV